MTLVFFVCVAECSETHVDAEGRQVVGVEEVVRDGLSQVEGQLYESERCPGICRGEDDPTWIAKNRRVCSQYHL